MEGGGGSSSSDGSSGTRSSIPRAPRPIAAPNATVPALRPFDDGRPMTLQYTRNRAVRDNRDVGGGGAGGGGGGGRGSVIDNGISGIIGVGGVGSRLHSSSSSSKRLRWHTLTADTDLRGVSRLRALSGERREPPWDAQPSFTKQPELKTLLATYYARRVDIRRDAPDDIRALVDSMRRLVIRAEDPLDKMAIPAVAAGDYLVLSPPLPDLTELPTAGYAGTDARANAAHARHTLLFFPATDFRVYIRVCLCVCVCVRARVCTAT
jgi:hypothetical protein